MPIALLMDRWTRYDTEGKGYLTVEEAYDRRAWSLAWIYIEFCAAFYFPNKVEDAFCFKLNRLDCILYTFSIIAGSVTSWEDDVILRVLAAHYLSSNLFLNIMALSSMQIET